MTNAVAESLSKYERRHVRAVLKWCLSPTDRTIASRGLIREWAVRKLDGLIGYSMAELPGSIQWHRAASIVWQHYCNGVPVTRLARHYQIKERTAVRDIIRILDYVIDSMTPDILASIYAPVFQWRLRACPKCCGDQFYDSMGTGLGGEYCCLRCGCRVPIEIDDEISGEEG